MKRGAVLISILTGLAWIPTASSAQSAGDADWKVCNETSYVLQAAVAYRLRGRMVSRGWLRFRPGECAPVEAPVGEPRYIYAESSDAYQGGIREWKGSMPLCVETGDFTSDPADACKLGNPDARMYISLDPEDPVTTLAEPDDYGRRAEIAGLQRLLKDNGYKVSRIDGVSGRRTTRNIAAFIKANKLPQNLSFSKKIDALETAAKARLGSIGLTVCNKSSAEIWVATGRRSYENWESRGWWTLPVSQCQQLVSESLSGLDMHVFARQKHLGTDGAVLPDKTLRNVATTPTQFCITEARFSSHGREDCTANGYAAANFRPVITDEPGTTLNLTDVDFVSNSVTGLRR